MTEEVKQSIEQFITESDYFEEIAHRYGADLVNAVTYSLQQCNYDHELLMSVFEDSQLWNHAMCLNDIVSSPL